MISTADVLEVDSCGTPAGVSISHLILRKRRNEVPEKSVARVYVLDRALASKGPRAGSSCTVPTGSREIFACFTDSQPQFVAQACSVQAGRSLSAGPQ